jgi:hypothetical protein
MLRARRRLASQHFPHQEGQRPKKPLSKSEAIRRQYNFVRLSVVLLPRCTAHYPHHSMIRWEGSKIHPGTEVHVAWCVSVECMQHNLCSVRAGLIQSTGGTLTPTIIHEATQSSSCLPAVPRVHGPAVPADAHIMQSGHTPSHKQQKVEGNVEATQ